MIQLGSAFGFPVAVDFTALLVLALLTLQGSRDGTEGLVRGLLYALTVFGSILVHELGHALLARRYRLFPISITLHGFGGLTAHAHTKTARQGLFVSFAGPLAGLALGAVGGILMLAATPIGNSELTSWVFQLTAINIFWSLFNLVPMYPLDGGWILFHLLSMKKPPPWALRTTAYVSIVMAAGVVWFAWQSGMVFLGIVAALSLMRALQILGR